MKTFYTDGTGSQQTLNDSQTEKVVVYDTINDAEADLANLAEGQIIATKDEDFEGNAVPVNEVTVNNMHSVTSNAVAESLSYSETEIKTGGKWVDGKPIYRKVINFGALPNTAKRSVNHNIANLGYFTSIKGIAVNTSSGYKQTLTLPYASGGTLAESVAIYTNYTRVEVGAGNDRSGYDTCYIVLEYTKTTD